MIHLRELWVVSLKSPSSVEYGIEKIVFSFVFYRELSRFNVLWTLDLIQLFLFTFLVFLTYFSIIFQAIIKIVNWSVIDFIFEDRGGLLNCSIRVFLSRFYAKFFKNSTFLGSKFFFWPTCFEFAGGRYLKTAAIFFFNSQRS